MNPGRVKEILTNWLFLMDALQVASRGTRPHEVPERLFVEELAGYWVRDLKLPLRIGRGSEGKQLGHFAEFVREARRLYPDWRGAFKGKEKQVALGSLDGHIRAVGRHLNLSRNAPR